MSASIHRGWSILLQIVAGASRSLPLLLVSCCWILGASSLPAIVDTNNNGLSDLWEKQYNSGLLVSENFDPQADPDGDGWTNAQEAAAGTDPLDSKSPGGFLRPDIVHTPVVMGVENGQPIVVTPEAVTVSWSTFVGKQYTLLYSLDLSEGSWLLVDEPFIGTGVTVQYGFATSSDDKCFWRVAIGDVDSDNDGLTDAEENALGTDPQNQDTDNDGLADAEEIRLGTNPNNAYSDTDTLKDGEDADPLDGVVNWKKTAEPRFAVIGLPITDPTSLVFNDLSDHGTVLFTKVVGNVPDSRLLIDVNQAPHSFPCVPPDLGSSVGYFGSGAPALIGDEVLGTRLEASGSKDCTWEAIANTYTPFLVNRYQDDIRDARAGFRVESFFQPATLSDVLLTPQGVLLDSDGGAAKIEKNGNVVSEYGYWKYNSANHSYSGKRYLVETSIARSATLTQTDGGTPAQTHFWNLVASSSGLQVAKDDGTFVKTSLTCDASHLPLGVTSQGWVASAHAIWSNGEWIPLIDLVAGPKPEQATLLGILDTGLGVAKLEFAGGVTKIVMIVPVEIEQQNYSAAGGIRFCRWLDSFFPYGTFDPDCADKDRDKFRIRIPAVLSNLTKIHIKSTGLEGAIINGKWQIKGGDGDYDVSLTQESGALVSTWMLLVSDGDDDRDYNGKGTDDSTDDQTLLADFNSPIVVTLPEYDSAEAVFHAQKPLGTLTVDAYYLSPVADPTGDPTVSVSQDTREFISNHIGKMKEIYRQIGIQVGFDGLQGVGVPQSWFDVVPASNEAADHLNPSECNWARDTIMRQSIPEHHIHIGYVDATLKALASDTGFSRGITQSSGEGANYHGFDGSIISLAPSLLGGADDVLGVTAHEIGHVMDMEHTPEEARRWLMKDNDLFWNDDKLDSKRFQEGDFDIIRKKNSYYVPN